jgi:hypothetical protein
VLERFWVDHIIAQQHRGRTSSGNLALACAQCNRAKGPNIAAIDPDSGTMVELFNPRTHDWHEHFSWLGPRIQGLTPIGRATCELLDMNGPVRIALRRLILLEGIPPLLQARD